jgi:hypothetical protein
MELTNVHNSLAQAVLHVRFMYTFFLCRIICRPNLHEIFYLFSKYSESLSVKLFNSPALLRRQLGSHKNHVTAAKQTMNNSNLLITVFFSANLHKIFKFHTDG